MPTLTIPTIYVKKLKELGVYDQWLRNVKNQWDNHCSLNPASINYDWYTHECIKNNNFNRFISYSFNWEESLEGYDFWNKIYVQI